MERSGDELSRVLIVDDDPANLTILVDALTGLYQVKAVRDGENALRLASETPPPDVVLLDIIMPGMDGYEVCRRLKQNSTTRDIPVIFLSALCDTAQEIMGLELGAVDYIHKPFAVPVVRARVANQLQLAAARLMMAEYIRTLEESSRLRDEMDNITQHDLKAPISPILAYTELLLHRSDLGEEERQMISEIRKAGFRMLGMINRSLDLYKLEAGRYPCQPQPQDVGDVIRKSIEPLLPLAESRGVGIDLAIPPLWAKIDENLAYSLFSNLIKNAIEATPPAGRVTVEVRGEEHFLAAIVANPTVVPEAVRDHFFEKFATAGKVGGTGVGTYAAQLMARNMGGEVRMETDPRFGTKLSVLLPMK